MDLADLHLHWRASKYKGKLYRSYSLARAYRKDKKNRKEIFLKLGKLSDEAADRWRALLKTIKKTDTFVASFDDIAVTNHFSYLDIATVNAVWDYWRIDEVFQDNSRREVDVSKIARVLTINRCVAPTSKSRTPEWFEKTALQWLLDIKNANSINTSRIFRELEVIEEKKEDICSHLFQLMSKRDSDSMESIFYDLSSTTFSGSRCLLMKWGHCKEGYRNHIVLAIVVNKEGLPFYWEVLPGGTADATTISWLLDRMKKRFKINNTTTLVFDRGMVSDDNLTLLELDEIKYITAMDKNQIEDLTNLDFSQFSHFDHSHIDNQAEELANFQKLNSNTYYQEITVKENRRYILCFNPQLFKDQRKATNQAITDFRAFVDSLNSELLAAKKTRQKTATYKKFKKGIFKYKLNKFVDVSMEVIHISGKTDGSKIRTYQGCVMIDEEKKSAAGKLDGFWLLVTNHFEKDSEAFKLPAKEAISPYRDKVIIEAAFRDIKSFVDVAPVFVWTKAHVKAHYTICVLSYLINRTLTLRLHNNKGELTAGVISHEKLYAKLSECMIDQIKIKNIGLSTFNMSESDDRQRELLDRIGLPKLLKNNIIKKVRAL
ncbi:MAG: IS1634 family transposase [Thermodesulfobacteriota bacterium]|nr:IS1634 family transposase [Thermodesulfobacteriota bacterium]